MFEDCSGRLVKCLDEAEAYIQKFIVENLAQPDRRVSDRSHDFDLYLPWLIEIVENHRVKEEEAPQIVSLERLYMDAAWSLVMKGTLRPGPRTTTSENPRDGYGKGYSLTLCGYAQLKEQIQSRARELREKEGAGV